MIRSLKLASALAIVSSSVLLSATPAYADFSDMIAGYRHSLSCYTLDCGHWYVGGSFGWSHLHDNGTTAGFSVKENGPGWNAHFGYQFNSLFGAELGYTQYYRSREQNSATKALLAYTEHYAYDLSATARLPLFAPVSLTGKLGVAYSHAYKTQLAVFYAESGAVSPIFGLGLDWSVTQRADLIAQWNRVRGNNATGSSDLWSVGFNVALA